MKNPLRGCTCRTIRIIDRTDTLTTETEVISLCPTCELCLRYGRIYHFRFLGLEPLKELTEFLEQDRPGKEAGKP